MLTQHQLNKKAARYKRLIYTANRIQDKEPERAKLLAVRIAAMYKEIMQQQVEINKRHTPA